MVAHDLHPDYLSTRFACEFVHSSAGEKVFPVNGGLKRTAVQHHHAHIASCMAEKGIDEEVFGVAFDGTGYGNDGMTWGGELMACDLTDHTRIAHFEYLPQPGGDKAAEQPWRMALSYLYRTFGRDLHRLGLGCTEGWGKRDVEGICFMIDRDINAPLTSSAGRLFDAVAAITGLCQVNSFEAEAAMKLESAVDPGETRSYGFAVSGNSISFVPMIREIVKDLSDRESVGRIAAKFHNTLARVVVSQAERGRMERKLGKVVLSGGTFQNKYLCETTVQWLRERDFEVYINRLVPPNDGGIALGQAVIAAKRRAMKCV